MLSPHRNQVRPYRGRCRPACTDAAGMSTAALRGRGPGNRTRAEVSCHVDSSRTRRSLRSLARPPPRSKMHPCGLEPPTRRRAFPERCKRAPTALRRSFTGSCWPRRLLSVTTFRADVAPPHVGSPSVQTRVAGLAKMTKSRARFPGMDARDSRRRLPQCSLIFVLAVTST